LVILIDREETMLRFRLAFVSLTALLLFSDAQTLPAQQGINSAPPPTGFSGVWAETRPASGPLMRIKFAQNGSQLVVWLSYSDSFGDRAFATATIKNGVATWAAPQSCVERFRSPGYNYDNPGMNTFALSFLQADGQPEPVLVYTQATQWNAPCGGHPIGTEGLQKLLTSN
jgi:hypothetical protein